MDRRTFVSTAASALLAKVFPANAQPAAKAPRIGVLHASTAASASQNVEAFKQGLRERGYVEGQNIVVERRFGDGKAERISKLAAELVRLKVDVIVTATDTAIAAVKQQTQTIPIVMANSTDPVGTGFVASLARPGGNVTGLTSISPELNAKRLELVQEAVPGLSRVAIMWNPDVRGAVLDYKETQSATRSLRLQLQSVEVSRTDDFDRAFSALTTGRAEGVDGCWIYLRIHESRADCELGTAESATVYVWTKRVRGRGRPHGVRAEHRRWMAARDHVCGQDPQGGQAG